MSRSRTLSVLILLLMIFARSAAAQQREQRWQGYRLPEGDYERLVNKEKGYWLWHPRDWQASKQENGNIVITPGAGGPRVSIITDNIPDGYGVASYTSSLLQQLRTANTRQDSVEVRRVMLGGVEAREICLELTNQSGEQVRETIWVAAQGARVYLFFIVIAPGTEERFEPIFKRMMLTARIGAAGHWDGEYEQLRARFGTAQAPAAREVTAALLAERLRTGTQPSAQLVTELAALASGAPDAAIDLLTDASPHVRAAAITAIAKEQDARTSELLLWAAGDKEAYPSMCAARALAGRPAVNELIKNRLTALAEQPGTLIRMAAALDDEMVRAWTEHLLNGSSDKERHAGLCLAAALPLTGLKVPYQALLATTDNGLFTATLAAISERRDTSAAPLLIKYLQGEPDRTSDVVTVLGEIGDSATITALKARRQELETVKKDGEQGTEKEARTELIDEIETAVKKIEIRARFQSAASAEARRAVRNAALGDDQLKAWADGALVSARTVTAPADISKLANAVTTGETLFPPNTRLYLLAPDLQQALDKFDASLSGIQMESVRDQMTLAFILSTLKAQLEERLDAAASADLSAALGIDLRAPMAVAAWPQGDGRQHSAVVARVTDRARFERTIALYQEQLGKFDSFAVTASVLARAMGALPAVMPLGLAAIASEEERGIVRKNPEQPRHKIVYARDERIGAVTVTAIEKLAIYKSQRVERETIYLVYLGTTVAMAPTREALADLLKAAAGEPVLASQPAFAEARAQQGEMIFFSSLSALIKDSVRGSKVEDKALEALSSLIDTELGALRLSATNWETRSRLKVDDSELIKSIRPFSADQLAAPLDIVPANSLLYAGAIVDPAGMERLFKRFSSEPSQSIWLSAEDEKIINNSLEGEIALAITSLIPIFKQDGVPGFLVAWRLKDTKAAQLFREGKLFASAARVAGKPLFGAAIARITEKASESFVTVNDNYMILADSEKTLRALEQSERLARTPDYIRSATATKGKLAFFVTFSQTAAFNDALSISAQNEDAKRLISVVSAMTNAFHSQRAYIAVAGSTLEGGIAVSFDREGRYSVGEIVRQAREFDVANALIAPRGVKIAKSIQVETLKLRVTAKQPGLIEKVRDDISRFPWHKIEETGASQLVFSARARKIDDNQTVQLPVTGAEFAPFLRPTASINSNAPEIIALAKQIAGDDRDARSVARKLGQWTYSNLTWKKVASDAVETLASREADCLEHSELYVALARALGLPARVVSGAAFSGGSFGAHAWVEIYLGKWVEIDPTWGVMDYVDATHLRFEGDAFISYAMLNQVEMEVVEARPFVRDYQRDPIELIKTVTAADGKLDELHFDFNLAAQHALGQERFQQLTDKQREKIIRAFDRTINDQLTIFQPDDDEGALRVMHSEVNAHSATVLLLNELTLLRVNLAARDGAWFITEIEDADDARPVITDALRAALDPDAPLPRILALINTHKFDEAVAAIDQLIVAAGGNAPLLFLKARALSLKYSTSRVNAILNGQSLPPAADESLPVLERLIKEWPDYAPGLYLLADKLVLEESQLDRAKALVQSYARLVPFDARPWQYLGEYLKYSARFDEAEAAYREVIARNKDDFRHYIDLAELYLRRGNIDNAKENMATAFQLSDSTSVFTDLSYPYDDGDGGAKAGKAEFQRLEELLLALPQTVNNIEGMRLLAVAQMNQEKYVAAIKSFEAVLALDEDSDTHMTIAFLHRKLRRFTETIAAADRALKLEAKNAEAYYQKACALAQLGRKKEALVALRRACELNNELDLEETDLKPLAALPEFKQLCQQ